MVILYLTCPNDQEAQQVSQALLEAKLVVCVRRLPIQSSYWWDGEIQHDTEILLMMESLEDKFNAVETLLNRIHSSPYYVLTMVHVDKTTDGVHQWLNETLK